ICPNCISADSDKPVKAYFSGLSAQLSAQCAADQAPKVTSTHIPVFTEILSCIKGMCHSVVDLVKFGYSIVSFLIKTTFDRQYAKSVGNSIGAVLWKIARNPNQFMGQMWGVVSAAVTGSV